MGEAPVTKGGNKESKLNLTRLMSGDLPRWLVRRTLLLIIAAVIFAFATIWAFSCPYRDDVYSTSTASRFDWWLHPVETNAYKRLPVVDVDLNDVCAMHDGRSAWIVGDGGLVIHTDDHGGTWHQMSIDFSLEFGNRGGELSLSNGRFQQSKRSSVSDWLIPAANASEPVDDKKKSYDQGQQSVIQDTTPPAPIGDLTVEGGSYPNQQRTQEPQSNEEEVAVPIVENPVNPNLNAICFVDDDKGWIVGDQGVILATTDGGETWNRQDSGTGEDLYEVFFLDQDIGWACSDRVCYRTTTGGNRWERAAAFSKSDLITGIQFIDIDNGWILTGGGLYRSTDGGTTFQRLKADGAFDYPRDFFFEDSRQGWMLDSDINVLITSDGGTTWTSWNGSGEARNDRLQALAQLAVEAGWPISVLGMSGEGLRAVTYIFKDELPDSSVEAEFSALDFMDDGTGWLTGPNGLLLYSSDKGASWQRQSLGDYESNFYKPLFEDTDHGMAVNVIQPVGWEPEVRSLLIYQTTDGGNTWNPSGISPIGRAEAVDFLQLNSGWLAQDGLIFKTADGGATWTRLSPINAGYVHDLEFIDPQHGWASGFGGYLASTSDGGLTWTQIPDLGTNDDIFDVFFSDSTNGWAAGERGIILKTTDGENWQISRQTDNLHVNLHSVYFIDLQTGWASGENGEIIATTDGGATWVSQSGDINGTISDIHFVDRNYGWATSQHAVLATTDGGQTWTPVPGLPRVSYTDISFLDDNKHGWIAGSGRTIVGTADGGLTWEELTKHGSSPPPFYYVLVLIAAAVAAPALRRIPPPEAAKKSVADMLVTDRPIGKGDPDPLKLGDIAAAMSRFLRNRKTEPPLTIAVSGEWGSGKSSLMNLLKADLEGWGFRPVWFNAWHHQKEEHLLAALLENIREQAIPPWWSPESLVFRLRLLCIRGKKYWLPALLLVTVLAASVGYFFKAPVDTVETAAKFLTSIPGWFFEDGTLNLESLPKTGSVIAIIVSMLSILRSAQAFRVKPAHLISSWWSRLTRPGGKSTGALGFRYRFGHEFDEITRALNPRSMLILIDDLDRCRPSNVTQVLEAINFLVTSGECFVVIGMDIDYVRRCVGLAFKDVAADLVTPEPEALTGDPGERKPEHEPSVLETDPEEHARMNRLRFAEHYLGKLINIEIPVPKPTPEQTEELMVKRKPDERERMELIRQAVKHRIVTVSKIAAAVVLVAAGLWFGYNQAQRSQQPTTLASVQSSKGSEVAGMGAEQLASKGTDARENAPGTNTSATDTTGSEHPSVAGILEYGETDTYPVSLPYAVLVPILILFVIGLVRFSLLPDPTTSDSEEFEDALRLWHPLIIATFNTPRFVKRYMNRVRYYAMCQRRHDIRKNLWGRIRDLFNIRASLDRKKATVERDKDWIPEDILVCMGAIKHCNASWLDDADPIGLVRQFITSGNGNEDFTDDGNGKKPAEKLLAVIDNNPNMWTDMQGYLGRFQKLSGVVHVR